jgi:CheY-like chemotaxis protein
MKVNKILLIDDNPATNLINSRLIKKNAFAKKIIAHTNVKEALDYLSTQDINNAYPQPELIFIDLNLPGMDGWDFLDSFRELSPTIKSGITPVILTTSANKLDEKRAETYKELGGYLNKPLTKEAIESLLRK